MTRIFIYRYSLQSWFRSEVNVMTSNVHVARVGCKKNEVISSFRIGHEKSVVWVVSFRVLSLAKEYICIFLT